jgi:hypothetical protein
MILILDFVEIEARNAAWKELWKFGKGGMWTRTDVCLTKAVLQEWIDQGVAVQF